MNIVYQWFLIDYGIVSAPICKIRLKYKVYVTSTQYRTCVACCPAVWCRVRVCCVKLIIVCATTDGSFLSVLGWLSARPHRSLFPLSTFNISPNCKVLSQKFKLNCSISRVKTELFYLESANWTVLSRECKINCSISEASESRTSRVETFQYAFSEIKPCKLDTWSLRRRGTIGAEKLSTKGRKRMSVDCARLREAAVGICIKQNFPRRSFLRHNY